MSKVKFNSVAEALDDLVMRGYEKTFEPEGEQLKIQGTDRKFDADELQIVEAHRFEGITDPQDMSVVYAIESRDGVRGVMIDAFGAYSAPETGAALRRLPIKDNGWRTAPQDGR